MTGGDVREEGLERIGDLLGVHRTQGRRAQSPAHDPRAELADVDLAAVIAALWPQVVGREISENARPVHYRAGRLAVTTSSSAWAHTLNLMAEEVRARLNLRLGSERVRRLTFRHAGWDEVINAREKEPVERRPNETSEISETGGEDSVQPAASAVSAVPLSPAQREALESLDGLGLEPRLRARVEAAMRAAFVREEKDSVR